jgi:MoaA/NifB/PqqE/SkfB family radical SAM enzyme
MCPRNYHGGLPNDNLPLSDWTYEDFVKIFDTETLNQLNGIFFCGNFGDPILNNDLIKMCQYIKDNKPTMNVRIHTNGGARNTKWWQELRDSLVDDHVVIFALDGLEDTHHLYRIGTTYENVTKNAKSFIDCGGLAEWVFIKFKHNEHQVEEAESRSKQLGFDRFTVKNTIRFIGEERFSVLDSEGNVQYYLEPPTANTIKFISMDKIKQFTEGYKDIEIDCYALKNKEVYIDAQKNMFPCCFLASAPYNHTNPDTHVNNIRTNIVTQYYKLIESLGGIDKLNTVSNSIKDIIDNERYQTVWNQYWNEDKLMACARYCGKHDVSKPTDQFVKRVSN